jgi:hypothetical protein
MSDREAMLIEVVPKHASDGFLDYLHRLGCSVETYDDGLFGVFVTFPETVDDEAESVREWCESWSQGGRAALLVEKAAVA